MENKTLIFIEKAKMVHGNRYEYSNVNYLTNKNKVVITCPIHGEFEQTPNNHLKGKGCPKCGIISRGNYKSKNSEQFISEAKEIHYDKYDYSKTIYSKLKTNVKIICLVHGEFEQTPKSHLNGGGCPKCGRQLCGDILRLNTEEFINKSKQVHGDKYDYTKSIYSNSRTKVKINCPEHGEFEQNPSHHSSGVACPLCNESKGEREIRLFLEKNNIKYTPQYKFSNCKNIKPLPFDFYLPEYNICIEYNGKQHYILNEFFGEHSFKLTQKNDKIKMEYCKNNNIPLIIIKYNENVFESLNKSHSIFFR